LLTKNDTTIPGHESSKDNKKKDVRYNGSYDFHRRAKSRECSRQQEEKGI
jgi:hypothetical protein